MTELLVLPPAVTFIVTISLILCVTVQTLAAIMSFYRYPRSPGRIAETLTELLIIGHIMLCTLLYMHVESEYTLGALMSPEYPVFRYIFFVIIVSSVILTIVFAKNLKMLAIVMSSSLILPLCNE